MTLHDAFTQTVEERNVINDCFSRRGGDGYDESRLISAMVYLMGKRISNTARSGHSIGSVTFGLIASDEVNATATLHPTHGYAIGLNVGLASQIFGAAYEVYPSSEGTEPIALSGLR